MEKQEEQQAPQENKTHPNKKVLIIIIGIMAVISFLIDKS